MYVQGTIWKLLENTIHEIIWELFSTEFLVNVIKFFLKIILIKSTDVVTYVPSRKVHKSTFISHISIFFE